MIRLFEIIDSAAVVNLVRRCLKEVNSMVYPVEVIDFMVNDFTTDKLKEISIERKTIVFESSGTIIGVGSIDLSNGYIGTVFVNPDHHGKHIGTAIMKQLIEMGKNSGIAEFMVNASLNAIDFYLGLGFKKEAQFLTPKHGEVVHMTFKI